MLRKILSGLIFLLLALSVGWMVIVCVEDISKAHVAKAWPTTNGVVVSSDVDRPGNGKLHVLKILYLYEVGSVSYVGNRYDFGFVLAGGGSESVARALVNKYRAKSSVLVHFNPEVPSDAVLVPEVSTETWWFIFAMPLVSVAMFLLSCSFLRGAWRNFCQGRQ